MSGPDTEEPISFDGMTINQKRAAAGMVSFAEAHGFAEDKYLMDPETDTVLYGDELKNGMRILSQTDRTSMSYASSSLVGYQAALVNARWCTVTRIRVTEFQTSFIALYGDGMMYVRHSAPITGWIVKKDSIPEEKPVAEVTWECSLQYLKDSDPGCEGDVLPRIYRSTDIPIGACQKHHELNLIRYKQ